MKEFIRDFQKRVEEIDKYFGLVDKIEQLGAFSANSIIFPSGEYNIDGDLQKILKSNCYLLLYNLIESSVRNGITAIHDAIEIDRLTYGELSLKIQELWVSNDLSKSFQDSYIKKETIVKNLQNVIQSVLNNEKVKLNPNNIPVSGNLDAQKIQELINIYGCHGSLGIQRREMQEVLNFIVEIRCNLAHGNVSFCDASSDIIWNRSSNETDSNANIFRYLVEDKEKVVTYLTHLLENIESFIDNKKYKNNQVSSSEESTGGDVEIFSQNFGLDFADSPFTIDDFRDDPTQSNDPD